MKADLARRVERETREKYDGGIYKPETICAVPDKNAKQFSDVLLYLRFELIKKYLSSKPVLDLCCGSGLHLMELAGDITTGTGLDYSRSFIETANSRRIENNLTNISFVHGDATQMPFQENLFGTVYSFSALYHVPRVDKVIAEIGRVLLPGGHCIIELGNLYSLNTIVCRSYSELAFPCHIPVPKMKACLSGARLAIVEHLSFQTLPMWGDRPKWLAPLCSPGLTGIMQTKVKGKMIDQWISSIWPLKYLAFRHIFVCRKIA